MAVIMTVIVRYHVADRHGLLPFYGTGKKYYVILINVNLNFESTLAKRVKYNIRSGGRNMLCAAV